MRRSTRSSRTVRRARVSGASLSSKTYTTTFDATENPLSEGGVWVNTSTFWGKFQTVGGSAFGTQYSPTDYDDNLMILQGYGFGPNQRVTVVVDLDDAAAAGWSFAHEVEIHLRGYFSGNTYRGYEMMKGLGYSANVGRWNGATNSVDIIETYNTGGTPLANGDVLVAEINGNYMTMTQNGTLILAATDSTFADGDPGIGSFNRTSTPDGSVLKHGFKSFLAETI
jgi:hypothetical protein